jgi:hypothetical protein
MITIKRNAMVSMDGRPATLMSTVEVGMDGRFVMLMPALDPDNIQQVRAAIAVFQHMVDCFQITERNLK